MGKKAKKLNAQALESKFDFSTLLAMSTLNNVGIHTCYDTEEDAFKIRFLHEGHYTYVVVDRDEFLALLEAAYQRGR